MDGWMEVVIQDRPFQGVAGGEGGGKVEIPPCTVAESGAHASKLGARALEASRCSSEKVFLKLCKETGLTRSTLKRYW
jgi:hypothetical protein